MLHSIIDVVDSHPKLTNKKLNTIRGNYGVPLDTIPSGIIKWTDLLKSGAVKINQSYTCLVKVKDLVSDDIYNRITELNITKAIESIEKAKGFSYRHASTLVAFYRMTQDGKLVLTQGNHRCAMTYLTMGEDAYVVVSIHVHGNYSLEKCLEIEADNFNTDNNERWNMTQEHRFKGGFIAGKAHYINLYNLVKPYGISIAGTNKGDYASKKTFEAYTYLEKGLKNDETKDKRYVHQILRSLVRYLKETDIKGYLFIGLVEFLKHFESRINLVINNNPQNRAKYSFDDFMHYIFIERRLLNGAGRQTTQDDIVASSGDVKNPKFFASRFVVLFNEYAAVRGLIYNGKGSKLRGEYAIPETCNEWKEFIEDVNPIVRKMFSATQF